MRKIICHVVCFLLIATASQAQNLVDKSEIGVKMFSANQDFLRGDYQQALTKYKELNVAKPNNASILFHLGQCYLVLNDIDNAVSNLEKSETADPNGADDLHLCLGQAYLQSDMVDKASKELQMYKTKYADDPKKLKESEVDYYIGQCNTATQLKAHPVNVTVTNLGIAINSEYDDKTPILANDG